MACPEDNNDIQPLPNWWPAAAGLNMAAIALHIGDPHHRDQRQQKEQRKRVRTAPQRNTPLWTDENDGLGVTVTVKNNSSILQ